MYHEQFWSTWSLVQWTLFALDLSDKFSDLIILFSVS